MKVLIDENLIERLHSDFKRHEAVSVNFMGWKGQENGDLVKLMIDNGFQVLLTLDKIFNTSKILKSTTLL